MQKIQRKRTLEQDTKNYVSSIKKQEIRHYSDNKPVVHLKMNVAKVPEATLIGLVRKLLGLSKKDRILFEGTPKRTKDVQTFLVKVDKEIYEISCNRPRFNWVASK
jgi:uncharacterized protein YggU (UPF0235/DUF167 family)